MKKKHHCFELVITTKETRHNIRIYMGINRYWKWSKTSYGVHCPFVHTAKSYLSSRLQIIPSSWIFCKYGFRALFVEDLGLKYLIKISRLFVISYHDFLTWFVMCKFSVALFIPSYFDVTCLEQVHIFNYYSVTYRESVPL